MRLTLLLASLWGSATPFPAPSSAESAVTDAFLSSLSARQNGDLPTKWQWTSTGPLVGPKNDNRQIAGIKDPTVVLINGTHHVFASTAQSSGYNLVYFSFDDWAQASNATFHYLDQAPLGTGYRAAPQVFWFAPHKLWYLVYQNGNAAYSTNPDINNPRGWTAPKVFYPDGMPEIIKQNIGDGYWVDMWVICDSASCHLFSSDDNGQLYRSQTSLGQFPNGMSQPVIAMQDRRNDLFEAACVYSLPGGQYLLLVEAIGSDGHRWFRSWTARSISGPWQGLANTEQNPWARSNNVRFEGGNAWTKSISHGEIIREGTVDEKLLIDPCNIRFMYQGLDPSAGGEYNALPWRLGFITHTNPAC
ncbi:GH62 arabinofuranosidase [Apiosordaria backusii]|uniref:Alpha-L-arabinofuranosidase n=1 Tax=Apiosordaria backusii TaxID=314023 RepID=A0AA40EXA7_9PEZI|nr:GH62 arabinofuranosidase [Apiosordaria backusii]